MNIGRVAKCFLWIALLLLCHHPSTIWCGGLKNSSVHLCCEKAQFYNAISQQCERLPQHADATWDPQVQLSNAVGNRTIEVPKDMDYAGLMDMDYDVQSPCEGQDGIIFEDYCFTPIYQEASNKYIMLVLPTKCGNNERPLNTIEQVSLLTANVILSLLLMLPIIVIYITVKDLRKNIRIKMFMLYNTSMMLSDLIILPDLFHKLQPFMSELLTGILQVGALYFGILGLLWLNVICYEVRHCFRQTTLENNLENDRKRFFWYSCYAWGFATLAVLLHLVHVARKTDDTLSNYLLAGSLLIIAGTILMAIIFNLVIFLQLSVEICRTRRRVSNMSTDQHFASKTVKSIVRVFATMGISTIVMMVIGFTAMFNSYPTVSMPILAICSACSILESVLIFVLFVMRRDVRSKLKSTYTRKRPEENITLTTSI